MTVNVDGQDVYVWCPSCGRNVHPVNCPACAVVLDVERVSVDCVECGADLVSLLGCDYCATCCTVEPPRRRD